MNYLIIKEIIGISNNIMTLFDLISYICACYSVCLIKNHTLYKLFIINKLVDLVNVFIYF